MSLFSQRTGIRPLKKSVQRESIDDELKNALWTAFHESFVGAYYFDSGESGFAHYPHQEELKAWLFQLWTNFLKLPSDARPKFRDAIPQLRAEFFNADWHWILDFLEFSAKHAEKLGPLLIKYSNMQFERENSAYRFVGSEIIEITNKTEMNTIEEALDGPSAVRRHLTQALTMLSDRRTPDFRNSIKGQLVLWKQFAASLPGTQRIRWALR
jgi:hypothetical protein